MTPILHIQNLTITRDRTPILTDLTWAIHPGQHWVILGPNGSGKTSLLSALTGYLTPTSGTLTLLSHTFGDTDWRKLRERIGIVSSAIRQKIPDYDPVELIIIGGKYAMIDYWGPVRKTDKRRAAQIMQTTECTHLAQREWSILSQGERQRVLIARALIANPQILILDEPCAGLDPVARHQFLQFLHRLIITKNPPTLIFVTHHVEEIIPPLTHALLLSEGKITAAGEKTTTLTTKNLTTAFKTPLTLRKHNATYTMTVQRDKAK